MSGGGGRRSIGAWFKRPARGVWIEMMESLILAQNERWRRVLSMQVEREWAACRP